MIFARSRKDGQRQRPHPAIKAVVTFTGGEGIVRMSTQSCKLKLLRLDTELPLVLPCPDMQPADAASSSEERLPGRPERRAVRKKAEQQRPVYKPKPAL